MNQFQITYPFDVFNFIALQKGIEDLKVKEVDIECFEPNHSRLYTFEKGKLISQLESGRDSYNYIYQYEYDKFGKRIKGTYKLMGDDVEENSPTSLLYLFSYEYDDLGRLTDEIRTSPGKFVGDRIKNFLAYNENSPSIVETLSGNKKNISLFYENGRLIRIENENGENPIFIWKENSLEIIKRKKKNTSTDFFYFEENKLLLWKKENGSQSHEFSYNNNGLVEQIYKDKNPWIQVFYK